MCCTRAPPMPAFCGLHAARFVYTRSNVTCRYPCICSFCSTTPCAKYGFMPILFILAPCVIQRHKGPAHATIAQLRLYLPNVWPSVNNVVLLRLQGASYSRWHRVKYEVQSIATVATDRSKVSRHGSAPIGGCRRLKANACGHTLAL